MEASNKKFPRRIQGTVFFFFFFLTSSFSLFSSSFVFRHFFCFLFFLSSFSAPSTPLRSVSYPMDRPTGGSSSKARGVGV
jgi:hypothetical protein